MTTKRFILTPQSKIAEFNVRFAEGWRPIINKLSDSIAKKGSRCADGAGANG
jgi:hypothetical protein